MPSIKEVHDALGPYAGIATSVTALGTLGSLLLIPPVRRVFAFVSRGVWVLLTGPSALVKQNKMLCEQSKVIQEIANQLKTNGGTSLKDAINRIELVLDAQTTTISRLEKHHKSHFWSQARPSLELDEWGMVNQVSEAACRLFQVNNPDELTRHSWLQFLDGRHVEEFRESFQRTAKTESMFRFTIQVAGVNGISQGTWDFIAAPLDKHLYSGYFSPMDPTAKEIAGRHGWLK